MKEVRDVVSGKREMRRGRTTLAGLPQTFFRRGERLSTNNELAQAAQQRGRPAHCQAHQVALVFSLVHDHSRINGRQRRAFMLRNPQLGLDHRIGVRARSMAASRASIPSPVSAETGTSALHFQRARFCCEPAILPAHALKADRFYSALQCAAYRAIRVRQEPSRPEPFVLRRRLRTRPSRATAPRPAPPLPAWL